MDGKQTYTAEITVHFGPSTVAWSVTITAESLGIAERLVRHMTAHLLADVVDVILTPVEG